MRIVRIHSLLVFSTSNHTSSHFYVIDHVFTSLIVSLPVFAKEQFWAFEHGFFPPLNHRFFSVSLFSDIMGHILAFNKPLIRGIEYPFKFDSPSSLIQQETPPGHNFTLAQVLVTRAQAIGRGHASKSA